MSNNSKSILPRWSCAEIEVYHNVRPQCVLWNLPRQEVLYLTGNFAAKKTNIFSRLSVCCALFRSGFDLVAVVADQWMTQRLITGYSWAIQYILYTWPDFEVWGGAHLPRRIFAPPLKSHAPPLGKVSMIDQSENLTFFGSTLREKVFL
jgi:hypothetical protein